MTTIDIQGTPADLAETIRACILDAIPGAELTVSSGGPGHFEIRVVAEVFAGKSRVQQQQLVYGAITHLMSGSDAPVHAIDRLECVAR